MTLFEILKFCTEPCSISIPGTRAYGTLRVVQVAESSEDIVLPGPWTIGLDFNHPYPDREQMDSDKWEVVHYG